MLSIKVLQPTFCLWYLCWCVTLKHQSANLYWCIGFINMLLSNVDPTGLISLYSLFNSTHLTIFLLPFPIFFRFSPLSPTLPTCPSKSTKKCLIVMQAKETVAPKQSDVLEIHLKLHVQALSWHSQWELLTRETLEWMKGGGGGFSVLLKDTSRRHMLFVGHSGWTGDLSV